MAEVDEKIHLNLDEVEKENTYETFRPQINGRVISMTDPQDIEWKHLLDIDNPVQFLKYAISDEDKAFLREQDIPSWKFRRLIEGYVKHYGLGEALGKSGSPF